MGLDPVLDGASLMRYPFRLLRPAEPVAGLLNGERVGVTQDGELLWRWGHPDYQAWLAKKFPQSVVMMAISASCSLARRLSDA